MMMHQRQTDPSRVCSNKDFPSTTWDSRAADATHGSAMEKKKQVSRSFRETQPEPLPSTSALSERRLFFFSIFSERHSNNTTPPPHLPSPHKRESGPRRSRSQNLTAAKSISTELRNVPYKPHSEKESSDERWC